MGGLVLYSTVPFVVMMCECSPDEFSCIITTLEGVYQPRTVSIMHEWHTYQCRLARAASMHRDDNGHNVLKSYAALKGLKK